MKHKPWLLALVVATLYLLHQDIWFWRTARPLVFAASLVLWLLVRHAWPGHLEDSVAPREDRRP
jgi:hypothetical protein